MNELIKRFEGLSLTAYPDPATRGAPYTVGYGHTKGVTRHTVFTLAQAEAALAQDVAEAATALDGLHLTPYQHEALVSFVFNIGIGAFTYSTLRRKLVAGDVRGAADEFLRWNRAAGRVMAGLTRRRIAERELFLQQD